MKAILISIKPKYVADILNGKKTIEIRKTIPQEYLDYCIDSDKKVPIDVYIYCTKDNKVFLRDFRDKKKWGAYWKFVAMENDPSNIGELPPILNGKVVAKFTLNKVEKIAKVWHISSLTNEKVISCYRGLERNGLTNRQLEEKSCLTHKELKDYIGWNNAYAWHIDNLEIFDTPKELFSFEHEKVVEDYFRGTARKLVLLTKAPQSWCYIEV